MARIFVIDNGGQWTHREWRTLRYLEVDTKIVPNTISYQELIKQGIDGLVLSGGAPRIGLDGDLGNCGEILKNANFPIMGICAGHQFMARFYGGVVKPSMNPEFGKIELCIIKDDVLFNKVPEKSIVWESHNDEITELPSDFLNLAKSESCIYQVIKHKNRPFYGLQFHPEVEHTEYGERIFSNFVRICEKNKT
jgi:GMP synthase (glutamine-hydrolysing)